MTDDQPSVARYPHTPSHGVPIGPLVCIVLAVAFGVLGATLVTLQAELVIDVPKGVFSLIGAAFTLAGGCAMALLAVGGVHRRLDRIEQLLHELGADEESVNAARRINLRLLSGSNSN